MEKTISENLKDIEYLVGDAKSKSPYGQDVKLIAVSKTVDTDKVKEAIDCGIFDFGENKPQELMRKWEVYNDVRWHQIGTLQKNKVKYIIDKTHLIHSVDSLSLCEEIDKRAKSINRVMPCLIQINISHEDSKHGFEEDKVIENLKIITETYDNIEIKGFMGMAPYMENKLDTRDYFKKLKDLQMNVNSKNINELVLEELSMGMSNDFEIAIQEGSTIVRVGTSIFGERQYIK